MHDLGKRLQEKGIKFQVDNSAMELICRVGYDRTNGARPLVRTIDRLITKPLSEQIIDGQFVSGETIYVTAEDDKIKFEKNTEIEKT